MEALTLSNDPIIFFESADAFRSWLEENADSQTEARVGFRKVGSGLPSMSWSESVDEALCFGWIDGVRKRIDEQSYSIRFTPRKPTSIWSAVNIGKVEQLRAEGRMTPAGEQAFALRQEHKSVVYAHEQVLPAEFSPLERLVFAQNLDAWKFFEALPPGYKKAMLHWVTTAKRAQTRATRLAALIDACASGKRLR